MTAKKASPRIREANDLGNSGNPTHKRAESYCPFCKLLKSSSSFYLSSAGVTSSYCRECAGKRKRQRTDAIKGPMPLTANCIHCNVIFKPKKRISKFCSRSCKANYRKKLQSDERINKKSENVRNCVVCGAAIPPTEFVTKMYCSPKCQNDRRGHTLNATRRIRTSEVIQSFSRLDIYQRDRWVCQLCLTEVDSTLKAPNPMRASLDHVIPLSRGGTHNSDNVQLAHYKCNVSRGNDPLNLSPRPAIIKNNKPVLTATEASVILGVSRNILILAIRRGRVPSVPNSPNRHFLTLETVEELKGTGIPGSKSWDRAHRIQPQKVKQMRELECPIYGKTVTVSKTDTRRLFCSSTCMERSNNLKKTQRPVMSPATHCYVCKKHLEVPQANTHIALCSPECRKVRRRERYRLQKPPKVALCLFCRKQFEHSGKGGRPTVTCSIKCKRDLQKSRDLKRYSRH